MVEKHFNYKIAPVRSWSGSLVPNKNALKSLWPCHKNSAPATFLECCRSIKLRQGPFGLHFLYIFVSNEKSVMYLSLFL
jgi:hypothetical protein